MKLKRRVNNNSVVICKSDKTGRMIAMSREAYLKAGKEHTEKDLITTREECRLKQRILNGHMSQWLKISRAGSNWGHEDRFRSVTINKSASVPPLYCLVKDHKKMGPGGIPRTRPVVSGNMGANVHLNNLISDLIEPIAGILEETTEVISTEESLRIIDDTNKKLKRISNHEEERKGISIREEESSEKEEPPDLCRCKGNEEESPSRRTRKSPVSIREWLKSREKDQQTPHPT